VTAADSGKIKHRGSPVWRLFRHHPIPVASLVVSFCALGYTIYAQWSDENYKELMIRPFLEVGGNKNYSIEIGNFGLGPAVVKRITYISGDMCIDTDGNEPPGTIGKNILAAMTAYMAGAMPKNLDVSDKPEVDEKTLIPFPNTIIVVGKKVTIFQYSRASLDKYNAALGKLGNATQSAADFSDKTDNLPLQVQYCSMSGRFCGINPPSLKSIGCPAK
jgi:hypothetical protein